MAVRRKAPGQWLRASLWLGAAGALLLSPMAARAGAAPAAPRSRELSTRFPEKPTIAPSWSIPVEPLGFAAPGSAYLGQRNALVSLDFLGEDRLLFTFRVPGLLRREPGVEIGDQRQIRAVVLALPTGAIQAQATWTVHDRGRYLQMMRDGRFLIRDRNNLLEGDASLNLRPYLRFPGALLSVETDPGRQYLATNSREPLASAAKAGPPADADAGDTGADDSFGRDPEIVARILRRDTGQVLLVSRIRGAIHLPINSEGYLDALRGAGANWALELNYYNGGRRILSAITSACSPDLDFLTDRLALVTTCTDEGDDALAAIATDGQKLWTDFTPDRLVWPLVTVAPNGLRLARESLVVSHSVNAFAPLSSGDIKGQWVRVIDTATGEVALDAPASPVLDKGGNAAISPSGRRVAVVNAGAIQVFELPAPPPLPAARN